MPQHKVGVLFPLHEYKEKALASLVDKLGKLRYGELLSPEDVDKLSPAEKEMYSAYVFDVARNKT